MIQIEELTHNPLVHLMIHSSKFYFLLDQKQQFQNLMASERTYFDLMELSKDIHPEHSY